MSDEWVPPPISKRVNGQPFKFKDDRARALAQVIHTSAVAAGLWTGNYRPAGPVDAYDLYEAAAHGEFSFSYCAHWHDVTGMALDDLEAVWKVLYG